VACPEPHLFPAHDHADARAGLAAHARTPPGMLSLGTILYVAVLFVNAIAILSEERFLARSACSVRSRRRVLIRSQLAGPPRRPSSPRRRPTRATTRQVAMLVGLQSQASRLG
jgi:hypothetical protein